MPVRDFAGIPAGEPNAGDLFGVDGDFPVVGGDTKEQNIAAVVDGIGIRTRFFQGECYLDTSQGVDYFGKILVKSPNQVIIQRELARNIAATPDVTKVLSTGFAGPVQRGAAVSFIANTIYSPDPLTGTVPNAVPQ